MVEKTAGQLANQALKDNTRYDARDLALGVTDDLEDQLYQAVQNYKDHIDQDEFCVVMILAEDKLIHNLKRRKFYCWPWLPSPRPNQAVFLYNKKADRIIKRLWVLPCPEVMAELATPGLIVDKRYQTMQAWSKAFFRGTFWNFIRGDQKVSMLSQEEHFKLHNIKDSHPVSDFSQSVIPEAFDFSQISCGKFENPSESVLSE
jgi:hypothetical protein